MWRFMNTTDVGSISSSNLAASMGSKNGVKLFPDFFDSEMGSAYTLTEEPRD
jgi:hypothetical protein